MRKYKNVALNNQYMIETATIACPVCKINFKILKIEQFRKLYCSTIHSLNWEIYFKTDNLYYRIEFRMKDQHCEYIYYYKENSCNIYLGDKENYSGINIWDTPFIPDFKNFNINDLINKMEIYQFFS